MEGAVQLMLDQDQQFEKQFDDLLGWVGSSRHGLQNEEAVSAEPNALSQQKSGFDVRNNSGN